MDLTVIKTLQLLVLPPASILLVMLLGLLMLQSHRLIGRVFIAAGILALYALSINPVSDALVTSLEQEFKPVDRKKVRADVIVILGGGAQDLAWKGLEPEPGGASLQRVVAGVRLYRSLRIPVLISGGTGDPAQTRLSDSAAMGRTALDLGVPGKDLRIDTASPNTLASAKTVKKLYPGKKVLLVTSAYHLKRSVAMFESLGVDVIPEPAGFLRGQRDPFWYAALPRMHYLDVSTAALSEHLSHRWYRLKGAL